MPRIVAIAPLLVAVFVLAGCVPQPVEPTDSPTPSPTAAPSSSPTAAPSPSIPPVDPGTPVPFGCADVVTTTEMYDYNSIYSFVEHTPEGSSLAGRAVAMGGIACRWVNTSSGITIDIAFAQPASEQLAELQAGAGAAAPFGYFEGDAAQAFVGPYWVSAVSADFFGADDAAPVIELATNSLR